MRLKTKSKKELSALQPEAPEAKDFFDRTIPGVIRFYTDHCICGNFYKSIWAVTEYPPNTEQTAILAHLADRNGVTLKIYNRLFNFVTLTGVRSNFVGANNLSPLR